MQKKERKRKMNGSQHRRNRREEKRERKKKARGGDNTLVCLAPDSVKRKTLSSTCLNNDLHSYPRLLV